MSKVEKPPNESEQLHIKLLTLISGSDAAIRKIGPLKGWMKQSDLQENWQIDAARQRLSPRQ